MKEEKEISLLNMCFYILSKWKLIIIAALAGAFLLGAVSYLNSYNEYKASLVTAEAKDISDIELTEEEIKALEAKIAVINEYKENIAEYDYYLENSIKLKMDPNNYYQGYLDYYFESDDSDDIIKAKNFFENKIIKESNFEELSIALNDTADPALLKEVVIIQMNAENDENGEFSVFVEHYDQADCKIMLDYFDEQMKSAESLLKEMGNEVEVQKISSDIRTCNDSSLVELSNSMKIKRSAAYDNIATMEAQMTEPQKEYYMYSMGQTAEEIEVSEVTETVVAVAKPNFSIKYMILGGIVGVFLIVCLYGVMYLFGNRIHNKEEMESWIDLPVYGYETGVQEKVNLIDTALISLKKVLTAKTTETPEMIAQMLSNIAKQADAKRIYLSGSIDKLEKEIINQIMALIAKENLEVVMGSSILTDAESLQDAIDCGAVVFFEKCGVSKENDVRSEVTKANICGIEVLGVVLES